MATWSWDQINQAAQNLGTEVGAVPNWAKIQDTWRKEGISPEMKNLSIQLSQRKTQDALEKARTTHPAYTYDYYQPQGAATTSSGLPPTFGPTSPTAPTSPTSPTAPAAVAPSGKGTQVPTPEASTEYGEYLAGFFPSNEFMGQLTQSAYQWPSTAQAFNPGMFRPVPTDIQYAPPPNMGPWGYGSAQNPSGYGGPYSFGVTPNIPTSKASIPGMEAQPLSPQVPTVQRYPEQRYPVNVRPPTGGTTSVGPGPAPTPAPKKPLPPPRVKLPQKNPPRTPQQQPKPAPTTQTGPNIDALYSHWASRQPMLGMDTSNILDFAGFYKAATGQELPKEWIEAAVKKPYTGWGR